MTNFKKLLTIAAVVKNLNKGEEMYGDMMYLNQEQAIDDLTETFKNGVKIELGNRILCLASSTEGKEMELLYKIAEIIKSGKKEVFIIGEKPGKTALGKSGLFSLTIGFR